MDANFETKRKEIKNLLKQISKPDSNTDLNEVKHKFKDLIKDANPMLIVLAESDLVNEEGFSPDDLKTACDVHLELFKDSIENPDLKVPEDHPIYTFQEEHKAILKMLDKLRKLTIEAKSKGSFENSTEELKEINILANKLMEAESHNIRQENTLFPILERHGIEQPPAIMWTEHVEMKENKKKLLKILSEKDKYEFNEFLNLIESLIVLLIEQFGAHTQKEEQILYVTALENITEEEWNDIKEECDNLGYFNLEY